MLGNLKDLFGYNIQANDGEIGKVHDIYFDGESWIVRYLVVDIGPWILGKKVLIAPEALGRPDRDREIFPVRLTQENIKRSPDWKTALPVSKQQELALHEHTSWPSQSVPFAPTVSNPVSAPVSPRSKVEQQAIERMLQADSYHMGSAQELMGYGVTGKDESLGKVDDLIVDDETWKLPYLVLDTGTWLSAGKKTLIATPWVVWIFFKDNEVHIDLPQDAVEGSPYYTPGTSISRSYEETLYDYYGRPYSWVDEE